MPSLNLLQKKFSKPVAIPLYMILYGLPGGILLSIAFLILSYVAAAIVALVVTSIPSMIGILAGIGFISGLWYSGSITQKLQAAAISGISTSFPTICVGLLGMGAAASVLLFLGLGTGLFACWIGWCRYRSVDDPLDAGEYQALDQLHKEATDNHAKATATLTRVSALKPTDTVLKRLKSYLSNHKKGYIDRYPSDKKRMNRAQRQQIQSTLSSSGFRDPVSGVEHPSERETYQQAVARLKAGKDNPQWFISEDIHLYSLMREFNYFYTEYLTNKNLQEPSKRHKDLAEWEQKLPMEIINSIGPTLTAHMEAQLKSDSNQERAAKAAQYPKLCIRLFKSEEAQNPNVEQVPDYDAQGYGRHILGKKLENSLNIIKHLNTLSPKISPKPLQEQAKLAGQAERGLNAPDEPQLGADVPSNGEASPAVGGRRPLAI